jgi:hypothetical protein
MAESLADEDVPVVREPKIVRTLLQKEADAIDCDIYRLQCKLESVADRIKTAGPALRRAAMELAAARPHVRRFMHEYDRSRTNG